MPKSFSASAMPFFTTFQNGSASGACEMTTNLAPAASALTLNVTAASMANHFTAAFMPVSFSVHVAGVPVCERILGQRRRVPFAKKSPEWLFSCLSWACERTRIHGRNDMHARDRLAAIAVLDRVRDILRTDLGDEAHVIWPVLSALLQSHVRERPMSITALADLSGLPRT